MTRTLGILSLAAVLGACGPSSADIAKNLQSPNPVVREDTAKIARNYGSSSVNKSLIAALADPSAVVRKNAVDSLAELSATEAAQPLADLLPKETDPDVQKEIIDALGRLKEKVGAPPLIALLEAHMDAPPLNAIWALGYIGDNRALDVLTKLRDSKDPYVAYNATASLRLIHP